MERLDIRLATKEDVSTILTLIRELADYENLLDEVVATEEVLTEWLFEKNKAEVLLALINGNPVGYALFFHSFSTFLGRAGLYLEDLYISPMWRSQGFGKLLLKYLASIALKRGCGRLEWACLDWNKPSINFYLSMGAEPLNDWTTYRVTGEELIKLAR